MSDKSNKLEQARQYIETAIEQYQPRHIFALYSGGHDSGSVTHFAATVLGDRLSGVVHVNTGIGIPETREHVRKTCADFGWRLLEYKATENTKADGTPAPMIYEDIVAKHGFPGPSSHRYMYQWLKERQLDRLCRDHKGGHVMMISGVRAQESTRRMGNAEPIKRHGRKIWVAPFVDMTALECREYMTANHVPKNPVKEYLHMSGECLCGAFAHKGELAEIEMWYPESAAEIKRIQQRVIDAGFPWGWEDQPPAWWSNKKRAEKIGQYDAFANELDDAIEETKQMLCMACHKKVEDKAT